MKILKLSAFVAKFLCCFVSTASLQLDAAYIPCKSFISFSYDDSYTLNSTQFQAQMHFIRNTVATLNHPERLRAEGSFGGEFNWDSKLSITQMQAALDATEQTSLPYSLLQQFSSLLTSVETLDSSANDPIGALIFISDTSDDALKNADRLFPKLQNITITFILMGTKVDSTKLQKFSSQFLFWSNFANQEPDKWDFQSYDAFGCSNTLSTTAVPSTAASTTAIPTVPIKADIIFISDNSFCESHQEATLNQVDTILKVLQNYTLDVNYVRVSNPVAISSYGYDFAIYTDLNMFINSLILCHFGVDSQASIDVVLRKGMSFAYQSGTSPTVIFVVFTINNGTVYQSGDDGSAMTAAINYKKSCVSPGNVGIIQINPWYNNNINQNFGDYYFRFDDPTLVEKFSNAILAMNDYDPNAIPYDECIEPIETAIYK